VIYHTDTVRNIVPIPGVTPQWFGSYIEWKFLKASLGCLL